MVGDRPADLAVLDRVGAPEHQQIRALYQHRPHRLLLVDFQCAHHMRHDDLRRTGRVIARGIDEPALEVHQPAQQRLAIVQIARALPAIGAGEGRGRADLLHAHQFLGHQIECLVPGDAHEIAATALFDGRAGPLLQPGAAHHRVFDAGRRVDGIHHAFQLVAGRRVLLPALDADEAAVDHAGAERTPMRAGQHLAVRRIGRRGAARQQRRREHRQRGAGRRQPQQRPPVEGRYRSVQRAIIAHVLPPCGSVPELRAASGSSPTSAAATVAAPA